MVIVQLFSDRRFDDTRTYTQWIACQCGVYLTRYRNAILFLFFFICDGIFGLCLHACLWMQPLTHFTGSRAGSRWVLNWSVDSVANWCSSVAGAPSNGAWNYFRLDYFSIIVYNRRIGSSIRQQIKHELAIVTKNVYVIVMNEVWRIMWVSLPLHIGSSE